MVNPEKQHGGDVIDKLLAAQANAALAEKNRIAKEDKMAADRHRSEMQNIERKRIELEKQKMELAQEQQNLDAYAKEQCKEIHNLYGTLKKYNENSPVVTNFFAIRDFEASIKNINIDVVTDIAYRDRYDDTKDAIDNIKKSFRSSIGENNFSLLSCYDDILIYTSEIEKVKIHSYKEKEDVNNTITKINSIVDIFPDLSELDKCKDILHKCSMHFDNRVACVKFADAALKNINNDDSFCKLIMAFALEKNIANTVLTDDTFKNILPHETEKKYFTHLYNFLEQCVRQHEETFCSDAELQKAVDYVATHAEQKTISVAENRHLQQHMACIKKIEKLCEKYSYTLKNPDLIIYPLKQKNSIELIAEIKVVSLVPAVKIFADRLCIYTAFKRKEVSIFFDDFKNAPGKLKKTFLGTVEYAGLHIASGKQYYDFFIDLQKLLKEHYPTHSTQTSQQLINQASIKKDIASEGHHISKKVKTFYTVLNIISIIWLLLGVLVAAAILSGNYPKDIGSIVFLVLFMLALFFSPYCFIRWLRNKHLNKQRNAKIA